MRHTSATRPFLTLSLGLSCLVGTAGIASALGSVSQLAVGDGTVLAKGAGIKVPVTYTCEGAYGNLFVQVRQRVQGGGLVAGSRQVDSFSGLDACTGSRQSTFMTVFPDAGSVAAFKPGVALALVSFTACDDSSFTGCSFITQTDVEFRLANK